MFIHNDWECVFRNNNYCFRVFGNPMKHEAGVFEITSPTKKIASSYPLMRIVYSGSHLATELVLIRTICSCLCTWLRKTWRTKKNIFVKHAVEWRATVYCGVFAWKKSSSRLILRRDKGKFEKFWSRKESTNYNINVCVANNEALRSYLSTSFR